MLRGSKPSLRATAAAAASPPPPDPLPFLQRRTALHLAAWAGQVDCLKALLAAGANINAAAQDDMNALHFAAVKGQTEAIRWLLNSGACWFRVGARDYKPI